MFKTKLERRKTCFLIMCSLYGVGKTTKIQIIFNMRLRDGRVGGCVLYELLYVKKDVVLFWIDN